MKAIKIIFTLTLISTLFFTSCKDDDNGPQGPGISLENCDESDCNSKSCAFEIPLISDIACTIQDGNDVDWYAVEVTQTQVDNNFGVYAFNFINLTDDLTFKVSLFEEGVASGDATVTGNGDLEYEPNDDVVGGLQFFAAGTYYISVQSLNNQNGFGEYEIRIN